MGRSRQQSAVISSHLYRIKCRQLLEQWIARLGTLLGLPASAVGRIGGGQRTPGGTVEVGVIRSLWRKGEVDAIVADYGHLVVDECHPFSAFSFAAVVRRAKANCVPGLSATVMRRDGQHPIGFMQCGPVRFPTSAKSLARQRPFRHRAVLCPTAFRLSSEPGGGKTPIQHIYAALAADRGRNDMIFDAVPRALEAGRSPLLPAERKAHARHLAERLGHFARNVLLLHGGMGTRQRREMMQRLDQVPESEEPVLVVTARHVGEGVDDARLDTLFLAMPISSRARWRSRSAVSTGCMRPGVGCRSMTVAMAPCLRRGA